MHLKIKRHSIGTAGFSLPEVLAALAVVGVLTSLSVGKRLFSSHNKVEPGHAAFPAIIDKRVIAMCEANENGSVSMEQCFRFDSQSCAVSARAILLACLNEHKDGLPAKLTTEDERLLLQQVKPCIKERWGYKLKSVELDLHEMSLCRDLEAD